MKKKRRFERRERRYLVQDSRDIQIACSKRAEPAAYHVRTIYVDHPPARLSARRRLRLRFYPPDPQGWLEVKRRKGGRVWKARLPIIATVEYDRTAFEARGVRVTIDSNLTAGERQLRLHVVEVKGHMPKWLARLLPAEAVGFSKLRWARERITAAT